MLLRMVLVNDVASLHTVGVRRMHIYYLVGVVERGRWTEQGVVEEVAEDSDEAVESPC